MNPYLTHPAVAAVEFLILAAIIHAILWAFGIEQIPAWVFVAIVPGLIVSPFYFGRESGQREHDIKNANPDKSKWAQVKAFFGAEFALNWTSDNWAQWGVAAAATVVLTAVLLFLH